MPSTYTTNTGIEKIATGEQSGTWGNTTNTNLDLIDQSTNGIVEITVSSAATSGSPNSLPITNGALSNGRNFYIEFKDGGDLGGTVYYQLDPNDAEKVVHVRNNLTNQALILFQGTYNSSNDIEIPNGKDMVVKFDGAGSGATVEQVDKNLNPATVAITGDLSSSTAGTSNFRAGVNAGDAIQSGGNYNVLIGDQAGSGLTTGDLNVAVGYEALEAEDAHG